MACIKSARSSLLLFFLFAISPPAAEACSCGGTGDTAAERAAHLRDEADWIDIVVVARFIDETSYTNGDVDYPFTFQNTTFAVKEVLFNRDPSGTLPSNVVVREDGTAVFRATTETTCCLCGLELSAQYVGGDFLLPITPYGGLSICDDVCRVEEGWCADIAVELRAMESAAVPLTLAATEGTEESANTTTETAATVAPLTATTTDGDLDPTPAPSPGSEAKAAVASLVGVAVTLLWIIV